MTRRNARSTRLAARSCERRDGFTLVELLSVLTLITILATAAVAISNRVAEKRRVNQATADILEMQSLIDAYVRANDELPATLADAGAGSFVDPWGRAYRYVPFSSAEATAAARTDRSLRPLNTDYDLYSIGADGVTAASVAAAASEDDVVRANDGAFVGPAGTY